MKNDFVVFPRVNLVSEGNFTQYLDDIVIWMLSFGSFLSVGAETTQLPWAENSTLLIVGVPALGYPDTFARDVKNIIGMLF